MPAYDYQCGSCDARFEVRQKMSDKVLETCPKCGGKVKRLISGGAAAITRGGSGCAQSQCEMGGECCGGGCGGHDGACGCGH